MVLESGDTKGKRKHVKLVVGKPTEYLDVRCTNCGALLYREMQKSIQPVRTIEIKCRRCGHLNLS